MRSLTVNKGGILADAVCEGQNHRETKTLCRTLETLDIENAGNALNRSDHFVEVLDVENFHRDFDVTAFV
jgi:hypothetical protein